MPAPLLTLLLACGYQHPGGPLATRPVAVADPVEVVFPAVTLADAPSAGLELRIVNAGRAELDLFAIEVEPRGVVELEHEALETADPVAVDEAFSVTVWPDIDVAGPYTAVIRVTSSDPVTPELEVPVALEVLAGE